MTIDKYANINLRGRSFKGVNLSDSNFSSSDIRGACFKDALLIGANFSNTRAGLSPFHIFGLISGSCILVLISGLIIGYSSAFPAFITNLLAQQNATGKELLIGSISVWH